MEKLITCPLTNQIFHNPVVASDGYTYEYLAILDWFKQNHSSPVTKEKMNNVLILNKKLKEIVALHLEEHSELKEKQFMNKRQYYYFKNDFLNIIKSHQWERVLDYSHLLLNDIVTKKVSIFEYICKYCTDQEITKYMIDNAIDYDSASFSGQKPIHVACLYGEPSIVKYLLTKNVEIDPEDSDGSTPFLQLITKSGDIGLIQYMIEKGADIEHKDKYGRKAVHYAVGLDTVAYLDLLIKNKVNLEAETTPFGWKPIHLACRYSKRKEIIVRLLEQEIDLKSVLKNEETCDELIYKNQSLSREEKQDLVYTYITKLRSKTDIMEDYLS